MRLTTRAQPSEASPTSGVIAGLWLFVSDEPRGAPRMAVPDRGHALAVLDAKDAR